MRIYFFCNDTATTEIYTLSLHDALPIYVRRGPAVGRRGEGGEPVVVVGGVAERDERLVLAAVVPGQPLPRHAGRQALGEDRLLVLHSSAQQLHRVVLGGAVGRLGERRRRHLPAVPDD